MARTPTEEGLYIKEIEKQLSEGAGINEITATKLQKIIGGKYSRIGKIVEEFKKSYKASEKEKTESPQPLWFKEMLQELVFSIESQVSNKWLIISDEINKTISLSIEDFENKKFFLEEQKKEDGWQIEELESKNENLQKELDKYKNELEKKSKNELLINSKNTSLENSKKELKKELKESQKENLELNKSLSNLEGQLKTKDDILKEKERIIKIFENQK